jgi:hypothetical protein
VKGGNVACDTDALTKRLVTTTAPTAPLDSGTNSKSLKE